VLPVSLSLEPSPLSTLLASVQSDVCQPYSERTYKRSNKPTLVDLLKLLPRSGRPILIPHEHLVIVLNVNHDRRALLPRVAVQ